MKLLILIFLISGCSTKILNVSRIEPQNGVKNEKSILLQKSVISKQCSSTVALMPLDEFILTEEVNNLCLEGSVLKNVSVEKNWWSTYILLYGRECFVAKAECWGER